MEPASPSPEEFAPDWPRPLFEPAGAAAELMYVVVGELEDEGQLRLSRQRHHVDRLEPSLVVTRHARHDDPAWFDGWFASPLGDEIDLHFSDPQRVRSADRLTVVRGSFEDPPDLNYLRNSVGVISALLDAGAIAVFDALAITWWKPADWREAFVDRSIFRVQDHINVIITDDERYHPGLWTHTRGMRKFGRAELQLKHLPGGYSTSNPAIRNSGRILHGLADYLAMGAVVRDGQTMHLPTFDTIVTFVETPDDTATERHFLNASLEVRDYDAARNEPAQGAPNLLASAERIED